MVSGFTESVIFKLKYRGNSGINSLGYIQHCGLGVDDMLTVFQADHQTKAKRSAIIFTSSATSDMKVSFNY